MPLSRPSFLFIVVDQMAAASLCANGNRFVRTPHLDALGRAGTNFTRAYCETVACMPARATLFTGLGPRAHGCLSNGCVLPPAVPTLPAALAAHGYRTHSAGKLHLQPTSAEGTWPNGTPRSWESRDAWTRGEIRHLPAPYYGLETTDFVGGHGSGCFGDYVNELTAENPKMLPVLRDPTRLRWQTEFPAELHYNDWITRKTISFFSALAPEQPFFSWCSFPDPHFPFAACREYSSLFDPASVPLPPTFEGSRDACAYLERLRQSSQKHGVRSEERLRHAIAQTYGMIAHIDDCVGRLLTALASAGRAENTVVVFLADHGEYLGSHGLMFKGAWPYEELWRVPSIWRVPGAPARGSDATLVSSLDVVPTVLELARVDRSHLVPQGHVGGRYDLPGRSLAERLSGGEAPPREGLLLEADFVENPEPVRQRVWITSRHKLVQFSSSSTEGILWDLESDPHETTNLWSSPSHRALRDELRLQLLPAILETDRRPYRVATGS